MPANWNFLRPTKRISILFVLLVLVVALVVYIILGIYGFFARPSTPPETIAAYTRCVSNLEKELGRDVTRAENITIERCGWPPI